MSKKLPPHIANEIEDLGREKRRGLEEVWELAGIARSENPPQSSDEKARSRKAVLVRISKEKPEEVYPDTESLIDAFPADKKEQLQEVWNLARKAGPVPLITNKRAELHKIQARIQKQGAKKKVGNASNLMVWYSAAAVLAAGILIWLAVALTGGETWYAPPGELKEIVLKDDTVVELNSGSALSHKRGFGRSHRTLELTGEAYFQTASSDIPFEVVTENAVVGVTGTSFNVRSWPREGTRRTEVAVISGSVFLRNNEEPEFIRELTAGEVSSITGLRARPELEKKAELEEITAWRTRQLVFADTILTDVLSELERRYSISINLKSSNARNLRVNYFNRSPESPESVLQDIALVSGLSLSTEEGLYILKRAAD